MVHLLWLVIALPLAAFVVLAFGSRRLSRGAVDAVGVGSIVLAAAVTVAVAVAFVGSPPDHHAASHTLWEWFAVSELQTGMALYLDPLSLVMSLVVTVVGALIHVYATGYMRDPENARSDAEYAKFFAFTNLFVAMMLTLVLGENLVLLYLGWEGVGLCSYLLIGFWYDNPSNGAAARKAFVVTRVGDAAMALGLFLLFWELGTLDIQALMGAAESQWETGSGLAVATALLLLGGAVGKSGQLPLQTWLPDAMAGPTPVSALIHAATMVTAGVYLIARTHVLFEIAPAAQTAVAVVGAVTLLVAGLAALGQRDIKRILAYSTISQIGYMFLALGVGAWSAAIFHLMTHAFFKAVLFMGAGAIIVSLHHEHDIFRMGGLRRELPTTFWTFLVGGAALAGFPLVTAGFYSKDLILWQAYSGDQGGMVLWIAGLVGALLTGLYTFRAIFVVFLQRPHPPTPGSTAEVSGGEAHPHVHERPGLRMRIPMMVLGVLSLIGGFVQTPATLGGIGLFDHLLGPAFGHGGHGEHHPSLALEAALQAVAAVAALGGIGLAWIWFGRPSRAQAEEGPGFMTPGVTRFLRGGLGFDALYNALVVRPYVALARVNRRDAIDSLFTGLAALTRWGHRVLGESQTGRLRGYTASMAAGAVAFIVLAILPVLLVTWSLS